MTPFPLLLAASLAIPGTEMVIVLDNSGSMLEGARDQTGKHYPPNDPERAAVLGALVVEGLARGTQDRVTVLQFGAEKGAPPVVVNGADAIRAVPYASDTPFRAPLTEARKRLEGSTLERRLLVIFTDGQPTDIADPAEGPRILGLAGHPDWDVLALGLYASPEVQRSGEAFLSPLTRGADGLVVLRDASAVVPAFTRAYARTIGSRPEAGRLSPGERRTLNVGRYVTEVMVVASSAERGDAFNATLTGPAGPVTVQAQGDNGCPPQIGPRSACGPPSRHYQVFRAPSDPDRASTWTLALPRAPGPVEYGIIYRYDLRAELTAPASVRVGEPATFQARLLFRGKTFDDEAFFRSDGFEIVASVAGEDVHMTPSGGGLFRGTWTPRQPFPGGPASANVSFRNAWLEKRASASIKVEGFFDLTLRPAPQTVALGTWRGERRATRHCGQLDLSSSLNADRVEVTCTPVSTLTDAILTCQPVASSAAPGKQPLRWEVCVEAKGCCGDVNGAGAAVTLAGAHPHYAGTGVTVPVQFQVERTGFLRCWWIWIASAAAALFVIWLIAGFVRPFNFDPSVSVRVAGTEGGLRRVDGLILAEQPGGRRGFYRNARICLDGQGDFKHSPRAAALVLEARRSGNTRFVSAAGLERKDARTGKWTPVSEEDLAAGFEPMAIYRVGTIHLQFT